MRADDTWKRQKTASVFGLTEQELCPIVESIAGEGVVSFGISVEHRVQGHYGYSAEKVIPTFRYRTVSGRPGRATVFAKRFHDPGPREAHHYRYLAQRQAPIARMYGAVVGADEREVVFLEYLRPVGDLHPFGWFLSDADRFRWFLAAAARFNAIEPSEEHAARLPRQESDELRGELSEAAATLDEVWGHACRGDLGDPLRDLCASTRDRLSALQRLAVELWEPIAQMKQGLVHNDYYPDSTGWRESTGELLVVDLESVSFGPRFRDVGLWLGAPDRVQPRCQPREELADHYLAEYARWGGRPVPPAQFLEEARVLCLSDMLMVLWFGLRRSLDGRVDWTDDREEGRRVFRDDVHRQLSVLLDALV